MAPKGGTLFLLLILTCVAFSRRPYGMPGNRPDFRDMKKLMRRCQEKGYLIPQVNLMGTVFDSSDLSGADTKSAKPNDLMSAFMKTLNAVSYPKGSPGRMPSADKMANMEWNCSELPSIIKRMRNHSEESVCYMHAFVASLSWDALTAQRENITDLNDYDDLLWASKPALQDISSKRIKLPVSLARPKVKKMMKMLREMFAFWSDDQRTEVVNWLKQQMAQNDFNCTAVPTPDSRLQLIPCNSSFNWLNLETVNMLGPYLCNVKPDDVESSPKEKLCEFFRTSSFEPDMRMGRGIKPSLARKFLRKCFSGEDFAEHVDKLGTLACHYDTDSDLPPDLGRKLLLQLNKCDNPQSKKLKERLVKSVMSNHNVTQVVRDLGSSVSLLSPDNVTMISWEDLREIQENITVQWTPGQMYALVKKKLGKMKCKQVSGEELMDLKSLVRGLPSCVLKKVKATKILNDKKVLRKITKCMRKSQLKAMLQGLASDVKPLELVQKLDDDLLCSMSLNYLTKVNITSLDQVNNKTWCPAQALYLAQKMYNMKQLHFRKLRSILGGVTCSMFDKVSDEDVPDMVQAIAENPQWLSKVQARCAAQKLVRTLDKKRPEYFKTVTEEELEEIPTILLINLPPWKVKDLPDAVCPVFLDKMEEANLSSLPLFFPSRPALTQRALLCLGNDSSKLTPKDVSKLGPLLCELQPSQLRLMAPDVLNSSLMAMASCQHIPQQHRADLVQLVIQTFGNPSEWSPEMMEDLGPLLLWDDESTAALPNKPWMKDVLFFLKLRTQTTRALRKKMFDLITSSPNMARKKRAASSISSGVGNRPGNGGSNKNGMGGYPGSSMSSDGGTRNPPVPTVEIIKQLGQNNVFWTSQQLDLMAPEVFRKTVETFGSIPDFNSEQQTKLKAKAIQAFGPVEQMSESVVTQMGCISQGFVGSDLEKLPFSPDNLEEIGQCSWSESQMRSVWKAVAKHNALTAQQLGAVDMVALDQFICGLTSSEMRQLNLDAFKDAVDSIGSVRCSIQETQQLKSLAVSAFGDPSTWDEAQVADMGNIIAGLDDTQMASLPLSVFPVIRESCIPLIPPANLASLSVAQLEALGPERADKVTREQKAALRDNQRAALQRAMDWSRGKTRVDSGAPSLSVQGILAFMKPVLVLLVGLLLL